MTEPPVTRFPLAKREIGGSALMECVRLRTKVVDSTRGKITLRSGQGDNDRTTILPESIREQMESHIERLGGLVGQDREANLWGVELPHVLEVKSPNSAISTVPSSGGLAGQDIQGQMIWEVPVPMDPVPQTVLGAATHLGMLLRDANRKK